MLQAARCISRLTSRSQNAGGLLNTKAEEDVSTVSRYDTGYTGEKGTFDTQQQVFISAYMAVCGLKAQAQCHTVVFTYARCAHSMFVLTVNP